MSRLHLHPEHHLVTRIGWLRAAVLGANGGGVSTASLIVGVAASSATQNAVLIAGVAGLVAGAMSMAAGEYGSVSSQSDTERADLARERKELSDNVEFEKQELAKIYVKRGLSCTSRCNRGKSGRCECSASHRPSDVLGDAGDGSHRWYWQCLWNSCLTRASLTI
jgi:hypothetical protein